MLDTKFGPVLPGEERTEPDGFGSTLDIQSRTAEPTPEQGLADLEAARRHLDRRNEEMALIAFWRDQLRRRLASANPEEFDSLCVEVQRFKIHCQRVSWTPSGRRRP